MEKMEILKIAIGNIIDRNKRFGIGDYKCEYKQILRHYPDLLP